MYSLLVYSFILILTCTKINFITYIYILILVILIIFNVRHFEKIRNKKYMNPF